jgi:diketogulonate reductase-like aldo/keto reductase
MTPFMTVQDVRAPVLMYGTAWKEERTQRLTAMALAAGFRAIDTANQRKHYVEADVGAAIAESGMARAELFLQTKFTYANGQDHRVPYDPSATIATQVRQSFESSLEHLRVDYLDSYVLHGPWSHRGWRAEDREAWGAMEELHRAGRVRLLGVSNVSRAQLAALCAEATVAPAFVQNRCYARLGWDREVRELAREHGVIYQGFSLLTANRNELGGPKLTAIARRLEKTVPELVFAFARAVGMIALTGTSDRVHMQEDLASTAIALDAADVARIAGQG